MLFVQTHVPKFKGQNDKLIDFFQICVFKDTYIIFLFFFKMSNFKQKYFKGQLKHLLRCKPCKNVMEKSSYRILKLPFFIYIYCSTKQVCFSTVLLCFLLIHEVIYTSEDVYIKHASYHFYNELESNG